MALAQGQEQPVFYRNGDAEIWQELQETTRNAVEVQQQLLRSILEKNANTEYLRRTELNGRTDETSFKATVPIITYADIEADIQRIADGDTSPILCADRVIQLTLSSGTSAGKSKMFPVTAEFMTRARKMPERQELVTNMAFPLPPGSVALSFLYAGRVFDTKGGLKAGTNSNSLFRSDAYKNRPRNVVQKSPRPVSPDEVILGYDVRESMYCHLLCGLKKYLEIESISSLFLYGLAEAFRLLEEAWKELVEDLKAGVVSEERVLDPEIREAMESFLGGPDLEAANRVEEECGKGQWEGIVHRLWPNAKYVKGISTGAMKPYVPIVQRLLGPELPLIAGDYGASEAWTGTNLDLRNAPQDAVYTLAADQVYLEFIPLYRPDEGHDADEELHLASTANYLEGQPVGIADVKIGQLYELVFTNTAGLYRYRMSDIVRVVGFYNKAPKVAFVCRKNVLLSVNTDKTDEPELMAVVGKAAQLLRDAGLELVDFTSQADISSNPGNYVIYWELKSSKNLPEAVLQKCCTTLDQSFNNPYMRGRVANTIGPLKLRVVKEGTFKKVVEFASTLSGGGIQYKPARCVSSPKLLAILNAEVVQEFESPDFPSELLAAWRPLSDS